MTMMEATPADLLELKQRIENKEYRPELDVRRDILGIPAKIEAAPGVVVYERDGGFDLHGLPDVPDWPGTEERDLWINVLNKKNRINVFQADNEQLIRALDRAEKRPAAKPRRPKAPDPEEFYMERSKWTVLGMCLGVLVSMIGFWLGMHL